MKVKETESGLVTRPHGEEASNRSRESYEETQEEDEARASGDVRVPRIGDATEKKRPGARGMRDLANQDTEVTKRLRKGATRLKSEKAA